MGTRDCLVEGIVNMSVDLSDYTSAYLEKTYRIQFISEESLYELPSYRLVDLFKDVTIATKGRDK
jgi:hypothetical protein